MAQCKFLFSEVIRLDQYISINQTRMPFSRRPISCLQIETQILTIWPWNNLDLGMTLTSFVTLTSDKSNQVKLMSRYQNWYFLWDDLDLDPMTFILKPDLDIAKMYHHTEMKFLCQMVQNYSPNRQTHTHPQKDWHTHRQTWQKHYLYRIRGR